MSLRPEARELFFSRSARNINEYFTQHKNVKKRWEREEEKNRFLDMVNYLQFAVLAMLQNLSHNIKTSTRKEPFPRHSKLLAIPAPSSSWAKDYGAFILFTFIFVEFLFI